MKIKDAIKIVSDFKGENLKQKLDVLKTKLLDKKSSEIIKIDNVYEAALVIKKISAQIDEIVHSTGIIKCLPHILSPRERIIDLSLASGADGEGIDLVTSKRIAEFKFSRWQDGPANGMRKRQVFYDLVNLYLNPSPLKKELYVFGSNKIITFFQSKKAKWQNVLSKSGGLDKKLEDHLLRHSITAVYLYDIYCVAGVTIIDIDDILQ